MTGFSGLKFEDATIGIDPSPDGAKRYLRGTVLQMRNLVDRSVERLTLTPRECVIADSIFGKSRSVRNALSSNLELRYKLGCRLIDLLDDMQRAHSRRRFWLVTLISDRWLSFDKHTRIWLGGMKEACRQVMSLGDFDGWFGLVEIQTLDETIRYLGRILMPHSHFVAWSDDPLFDPEQAASLMQASGRLESRVWVATADVRRDPTTSVCNIAAYIMKAPAVAKYRVYAKDMPAGFALTDCKLPPVSAVRQTEILSQTTFDELMFSGGQGRAIRSALLEVIRPYMGVTGSQDLDTIDAEQFWRRLRRNTRRRAYGSVTINRTGAQLSSNTPISLALNGTPTNFWIQTWLLMSGQLAEPWWETYYGTRKNCIADYQSPAF